MSRKWINFFTEAGIPSSAAATYALIFSENRIQENMLLDLDREVLKEMGIQLMGDVISILKHARYVHEKTARDSVLQSSEKDKMENPGKKTIISTVPIPENDPYFYSNPVELKKAEEKRAQRKEGPVLPPSTKVSKVSSSTSNKVESSSKTYPDSAPRKYKTKLSVQKGVIIKEEAPQSDSSSDSSSNSSLECISKPRKAPPEPTVTSQAILKPQSSNGSKRTVSILDKEPEYISKTGTTFTITMSGSNDSLKTADESKKSVFSRLDSKLNVNGSASSTNDPEVVSYPQVYEEPLDYDTEADLLVEEEFSEDPYVSSHQICNKVESRKINEQILKRKPLVQTEGILANPAANIKISPKERLGMLPVAPAPSLDYYDSEFPDYSYDPMVNNYQVPLKSSLVKKEVDKGEVVYNNRLTNSHLKKEPRTIPVAIMDYEEMRKPSVKERISFDQPSQTRERRPGTSIRNSSAEPLSIKSMYEYPKSVKERITVEPRTSIKQRIGLTPASLVKQKISLKSRTSVRDRISLKPNSSVKDRISLKPATSVKDRIRLKSTPSVKDRISLKSSPLLTNRISVNSSSVRNRISFGSNSVNSRLLSNSKLNRNNFSRNSSNKSVFNRLD